MTTGLRRFVAPAGTADSSGRRGTAGTAAESAEPAAAACELCAQPLTERHGHLVDLHQRGILCGCRPCYLLFTADGAGGHRYRAVPERYRHAPRLPVTDAVWHRLDVPVGLAFFFHHSELERPVALYPSPAGATESELALETWTELSAAAPALTGVLLPDVEALLINRIRRADAPATYEGFAVPVDACYRLVGLVRQHWRGFDGGEQAWRAIDAFLAQLRERAGTPDWAESDGRVGPVGGHHG